MFFCFIWETCGAFQLPCDEDLNVWKFVKLFFFAFFNFISKNVSSQEKISCNGWWDHSSSCSSVWSSSTWWGGSVTTNRSTLKLLSILSTTRAGTSVENRAWYIRGRQQYLRSLQLKKGIFTILNSLDQNIVYLFLFRLRIFLLLLLLLHFLILLHLLFLPLLLPNQLLLLFLNFFYI